MKPTQEQVIAWAQEACGDPAWEGGVEWVWGEVRRFASLAYDAGRKDENEACAKKLDALLNHCPYPECNECAKIICPFGNSLHFHHDGCPACAEMAVEQKAAAIRARREQ